MLIEVHILYRANVLIPSRQEACEERARHAVLLRRRMGASSFDWGSAAGAVPIGVTIVGDAEDAGESLASIGFFGAGDEFGRALGDDAAAAFAALRAEVDDPVGLFDDVEVMLDDQDGVAEGDEALKDVEEFANVVKVQSGGGFIEDVKCAASLALGKFVGQLDPLRFAAGKSGGGLAECDVTEADFDERRKLLLDLRNIFEELQRIGRGQVEHVADGVALVTDR